MSTDKCVFCYRQSNVGRLFPTSDYCWVHDNQIVEHSSDNETVNGRICKIRAAEYLIDGSEKYIVRSSFDFRVRVSFKGAVKIVSDLSINCRSFTANTGQRKGSGIPLECFSLLTSCP